MNVYCFSSSVGHSFRCGSGSISHEAVRSQNVTQAAMVDGLMEDWKGCSQVGSLMRLSGSTGSYRKPQFLATWPLPRAAQDNKAETAVVFHDLLQRSNVSHTCPNPLEILQHSCVQKVN